MSKLNPTAKPFFPFWWNKEENKIKSDLNPNAPSFFPCGLNPNAPEFFPRGLNPNAKPFEPELSNTSRFIDDDFFECYLLLDDD